jgi:hypothetical protein
MFLLGLFVGSVKIGHAVPLTVNRTFTSESTDGYTAKEGPLASYLALQSATSATYVYGSLTHAGIGQHSSPTYVYIHRAYVPFDTSILPNGANITTAILSIYVEADYSYTDFNVTIQNGQPTYPHLPIEFADYYTGYYSGDGGTRNTTSITGTGYWNITLSPTGRSWIDVDGTTKLCLRSNKDIEAIPVGESASENIYFSTFEQGSAYTPKLYVTYETEGFSYVVHGPYYENGAVATCTTVVTLQIENMASNSTVLNGTDGVADTVTYSIEQAGIAFSWNISDAGMNKTRTYYLIQTATFDELWIFLPNPDEPAYLYTFFISDLAGIQDGYLSTSINVAGVNRVVEREKTDIINTIPFWMIQFDHYTLTLTCSKGTYVWGDFVAQTNTEQTLLVTPDMFAPSYPGNTVNCTCMRRNDTWIQINYTDPQNLTSWLSVSITHKEHSAWLSDYTTNVTTNPIQINWYTADSTIDYRASATALWNGTQMQWSWGLQHLGPAANPWTGLFDILGTFPFPAANLVGFIIVMFTFAAFTYVHMVAGCFIGLVVAGLLNYLGWLTIGWNLVALGFAVVILAAIVEAKRTEALELG